MTTRTFSSVRTASFAVLVSMAVAACGGRSALFNLVAVSGAAGGDSGDDTIVPLDDAGLGEQTTDAQLPDSDALVSDDAASGAIDATGIPAVAPCLLAPNVIYATATGAYGVGLSGTSELVGAAGTWIVPIHSPGSVQFDSPDAGWIFVATAAVVGGPYELAPEVTFESGPGLTAGGAYAQVAMGGASCGAIPTGTFTVVDVAFDGQGDDPPLLRLLASFDLTCGDGGELVGCARYTK